MFESESRTRVEEGTVIEKDGTEYEIIQERTVDDPIINHGYIAVQKDRAMWPPNVIKLQWPDDFAGIE